MNHRAGLSRRHSFLMVAAMLGIFLAVAWAGAFADARGHRVLGFLDPLFGKLRGSGGAAVQSFWTHRLGIVWAVTAIAALTAAAGFRVRRRAVPIALLALGISLAAWGQLMLLHEHTALGWTLYGVAVFCLALFGHSVPMESLPAAPRLASPGAESLPENPRPDGTEAAGSPPFGLAEALGVLGLTAAGLLLRAWALMDLPNVFDDETINVMTWSATFRGFGNYLRTELLGTGNGVFHVLTNNLLFRLFGTSIYSVRLTALLWGTVAIPLIYFLARRMAGRVAAVASTALFICAPEQLFWARNENSFFSLVAVMALVTAHLCLFMVQRFSARAVLAAALWMPFCRFFYTPCFVMFTLPPLVFAHALLFVRGTWRRAWIALPLLLGGVVLWTLGLSLVVWSASGGKFRFINPTTVRGVAAWKQDIPADAGPVQILGVQARRVSRNAAVVMEGLAVRARYQSHWYSRAFVSDRHPSMITAGLMVLFALGLGYQLGQPLDRRAALLVIWTAVALLPGCMSDEPEARRISLVFPAVHVLGGILFAAALQALREGLPAPADHVASSAVVLGVAATAFCGLVSHLRLPVSPLPRQAEIRFARPLFERCGTVLHNLFYRPGETLAFGNLDRLIRSKKPLCYQYLLAKDWPQAALYPPCDFSEAVFTRTLSPEKIERLRKAPRSGRVGYLLEESVASEPHIEMLRRLYPDAVVRRQSFPDLNTTLSAFEVDGAAIRAMSSPSLDAGGLAMRGGVLLPADGWFRFALDPPCAGAVLSLAPEAASPARSAGDSAPPRPRLAGIHPFELSLSGAGACGLPLRVLASGTRGNGPVQLVSPRAAELAPAPPLEADTGYGEAQRVAGLPGTPIALGADASGSAYALLFENGSWEVRKYAPDGSQSSLFRPDLPADTSVATLAVSPDGECAVVGASRDVQIYDRAGTRTRTLKIVADRPPTDLAFTPGGRLLVCLADRHGVEAYARDGTSEGVLSDPGGGHRMINPMGLAVSPEGDLVVVEESGRAYVFGNADGTWPPPFVTSFRVAFWDKAFLADLRECAFDGPVRILFPHRNHPVPLVYDPSGRRVLAAEESRDLGSKGFQQAAAFGSTRDALYVLDIGQRALYRLAR